MDIFQYIETSDNCKNSTSYEIDNSISDANRTIFYRKKIGNRYINYYIRKNTGLSKLINGEFPRLFIFLPQKASEFLRFVRKINHPDFYKTPDVLRETYQDYPYIINVTSLHCTTYFDDISEKFHEEHPEIGFYMDSVFSLSNKEIDNRAAIICYFGESKNFTEHSVIDALNCAIKYADHLMVEIMKIKIDLNKFNIKKHDESGFDIPPIIRKAFIYGGVFAIKFAARSVGSDFNTNIDFDIDADVDVPDISDMGDMEFGIPEFEFDSDSEVDLGIDNNSMSSISFKGAPNDGTYTDTGQKVSVRSDSGVMYNDIHVFLHHGLRYIDFKNQFIQIPGSRLFSLNGNGYKVI